MVDHIQPIRLGGLPYDPANLAPLCYICHQRKRGKEGHQATPGEGVPVLHNVYRKPEQSYNNRTFLGFDLPAPAMCRGFCSIVFRVFRGIGQNAVYNTVFTLHKKKQSRMNVTA